LPVTEPACDEPDQARMVGSLLENLAEGEGFEPPKACTLVVFKTTAIDHSAIPPATINDTFG
jgi:hypothetical protein